VVADSVCDADGPGWRLDRARFDAWLRDSACGRGAALVAPARAVAVEAAGDEWRLTLMRHGRPLIVSARWLMTPADGRRRSPDAGGSASGPTGLVCRWLAGLCADVDGSCCRHRRSRMAGGIRPCFPERRRILAFTQMRIEAARSTIISVH
jgi:hypothetical protein